MKFEKAISHIYANLNKAEANRQKLVSKMHFLKENIKFFNKEITHLHREIVRIHEKPEWDMLVDVLDEEINDLSDLLEKCEMKWVDLNEVVREIEKNMGYSFYYARTAVRT